MKRVSVCVLTAALVVVLDRLSKNYFIVHLPLSGDIVHWGFLSFVRHTNFGVVANIPIPHFLVITITLAVLLFIAQTALRALQNNQLVLPLSLSILFGGALGNLWDRVAYGYVFDWLLLFNRSIVNIADAAIITGLVGTLSFIQPSRAKIARSKKI